MAVYTGNRYFVQLGKHDAFLELVPSFSSLDYIIDPNIHYKFEDLPMRHGIMNVIVKAVENINIPDAWQCLLPQSISEIVGYGWIQFYYHYTGENMAKVIVTHDKTIGAYEIEFRSERRDDWKNFIEGVIALIKTKPVSDREYNPTTKKWTILERHWAGLELVMQAMNFKFERHEKVHPKNWHYEQEPASKKVPKETLAQQLIDILGCTLEDMKDSDKIKKLYRRKALELHPDRNAGDGSKMSELNSIWSAYNA